MFYFWLIIKKSVFVLNQDIYLVRKGKYVMSICNINILKTTVKRLKGCLKCKKQNVYNTNIKRFSLFYWGKNSYFNFNYESKQANS